MELPNTVSWQPHALFNAEAYLETAEYISFSVISYLEKKKKKKVPKQLYLFLSQQFLTRYWQ